MAPFLISNHFRAFKHIQTELPFGAQKYFKNMIYPNYFQIKVTVAKTSDTATTDSPTAQRSGSRASSGIDKLSVGLPKNPAQREGRQEAHNINGKH